MKLTGENRSTRGKNLSQCHFAHHKSHMDWPRDRTRASAVGGRRLTAWAMALPSVSINAPARKYCNFHERISLWHLVVECSVINQLRIDFGAFTCNILGSDFVSLLFSVRKQNSLFGQEVVRINPGHPGTYNISNFWRSQWPRGVSCGSTAVRLLGLWFGIPSGAQKSVCCECCVLSGRGLCFGLITRREESYECGVSECDREASVMSRHWPTRGSCTIGRGDLKFLIMLCNR
jgi:hypothetical protein